MAKFDIKTVKPKFVVTTNPDNKIEVVVNKPIITSKLSKSFFQLKNTGGPRGLKGDQGEPGQDSTIEVVSTTTGAAGTDASVVNQGTASAAQLAFTIPRGDKGEQGVPGSDGYSPTASVSKSGDTATITITDKNGTTTASVSDGVDGTDGFSPSATVTQGTGSATISITDKDGTTTATVYDGQDGQDGAPGQAATIAVSSTTTLPAGSSATVENVGTSSAASLAFGIPQGVAGQDGADGADGFSPTATVTQTSSGATISITDKDGTTTADVSNGADGADGDAATITVGQVETLQPNQSAYVTNVGTSSAAIFNIGIPQGQKGEAGSGSGDMLAADYDPNSTVKNAGGIPDYVSSQLPGDMTGATSSTAGTHGLVPAPAVGDQGKVLKGDGTWATLPSPELVEMSYGESNAWAKFIAAYNAHCVVYCRASSNSNPATGSQTRKAFMAYVNNESSPTSVEFQYYRSVSSHSDSQQGDQVFVYTLTNSNGGTWSVASRNTFSKVVAGTNMTSSYSSGTLTLNATQPTVPTKTSDLTNDGADGTSTYVEADDLATVATSGSYNDLSNKPTIPAAQVNSDWNANSGVAEILNKPSLATVATSGSYTDLSNKPTIPTVNDATLTISQNGTTVGTFTANDDDDVTIALTDTTYSAFGGATSSVAGTAGLVPAPTTSDPNKFLKGDGTWATPNAGGTLYGYLDLLNSQVSGSSWFIYRDTGYSTVYDCYDLQSAILAGKKVIIQTKDLIPVYIEVIAQYDDQAPYDFAVSYMGALRILRFDKLLNTWSLAGNIVNDATLTIQHNGTTVDTFTANASANKTVNIETIYADTITPTTAVATIGTTQIADGAVTSAKIASGVLPNFNYSYNEIDTGTTWLQGQKIYSMTYYFAALANYGVVSQPLPTGWTATVKIEGILRNSSMGATWALPYPNCYFDTAFGNLELANPNYDFSSGFDALVTLYYVKSS